MEKHIAGRKKRLNEEEKETEMKDEKYEKMWNFYENLNTEHCLK